MRKSAKLFMIAATAALTLGAVVGTATAGRLSSSSRNIRATWTNLRFQSSFGVTVECPVTLAGNFVAQTIAKVARSLIGAITTATVNQAACTGGTGATFNGTERFNGTTTSNTLPWHLTYEGFRGTLPNITGLDVLLARFRFGVAAAGLRDCQYGDATDNISGLVTRDTTSRHLTTINPVAGRNTARRIAGSFLCPAFGTLVGTGNVDNGAGVRVTVTLI